jgi:hypothetical protein
VSASAEPDRADGADARLRSFIQQAYHIAAATTGRFEAAGGFGQNAQNFEHLCRAGGVILVVMTE